MVEFEEAQGYAEENGLLFMETSAKTAMNVNEIFLAIGEIFVYERDQSKSGRIVELFVFSAKKLPKYEQVSGTAGNGQGRRLGEGETPKQAGNCCK